MGAAEGMAEETLDPGYGDERSVAMGWVIFAASDEESIGAKGYSKSISREGSWRGPTPPGGGRVDRLWFQKVDIRWPGQREKGPS